MNPPVAYPTPPPAHSWMIDVSHSSHGHSQSCVHTDVRGERGDLSCAVDHHVLRQSLILSSQQLLPGKHPPSTARG